MRNHLKFTCRNLIVVILLAVVSSAAISEQLINTSSTSVMTLNFSGVEYLHRWSKNGQNEFTPPADTDLSSWRDMITVNVHENVGNGDQLAMMANAVLGNYQRYGKVLRTNSKPATADTPAEHFVMAVLGNPGLLEAVFARFVLVDGAGYVVVYSHRIYGKAIGPEMSDWLKANGARVENTLMAWSRLPELAALQQLPQSQQ